MSLNIFSQNGFSTISQSAAIENFASVPGMLGGMGIFTPKPVRSKDVFIEVKDDTNKLLGIVERGAPLQQLERGSRKKVNFEIPKVGQQETIWAHEIAGIHAFGNDTVLMQVATELGNRLSAQKQNIEYTKEYMRLAAVQGKFLNPATGAVIYDYFAELGVTEAPAVNFALGTPATKVKELAEKLVIDIQRSSKGAWVMGQTRVHALVGDQFWFDLTQHANVEKYYANWPAMAMLKNLDPSDTFDFGGVIWHRYVGSDDNTEIAVNTNEAKFFPVGARDVFTEAMAPADEFIPYVGTLGQSIYAIKKTDSEYEIQRWVGYDVVSYPLFMCNRPNLLRKGIRA